MAQRRRRPTGDGSEHPARRHESLRQRAPSVYGGQRQTSGKVEKRSQVKTNLAAKRGFAPFRKLRIWGKWFPRGGKRTLFGVDSLFITLLLRKKKEEEEEERERSKRENIQEQILNFSVSGNAIRGASQFSLSTRASPRFVARSRKKL